MIMTPKTCLRYKINKTTKNIVFPITALVI